MENIFTSLASIYCFHNDEHLTLENSITNLSAVSGYTPEELENKFQEHLLWMILPEDRPVFFTSLNEQLLKGNDIDVSFRIRHKNGNIVFTLNKIRRVISEDDTELFYGVMMDITKYDDYHWNMRKSMEQYQIILSQTKNVTFEIDIAKDIITFSDRWNDLFGYIPKTNNFLATLPANSHIHPGDIPALLQHLNNLKSGTNYSTMDLRISTGGQFVWFCLRATAVRDTQGNLIKIVGIILNIDAEKKETSALQAKAECDSLTKLLNKATSKKQAEDYLNSYPNGAYCALMVIDLDNFKQINDRFGHMFGDKVLLKAAEAIKQSFRTRDLVARIGGDEFMVLMKDIANLELIKARCAQVISSFQTLIADENVACETSCSIGVALSPHHATTYEELFKSADKAMYDAKSQGKNNFSIYSPADTYYY